MKDYSVITNPMTWGMVTGCIFFYDYRKKSNGKYPIKIRISYKRERVYYNTGYSMTVAEWKNYNTGRGSIAVARLAIQKQLELMAGYVKEINKNGEFSFDLLATKMSRGKKEDVFAAFDVRIAELKAAGQSGTALVYECALNSLKAYQGTTKLPFKKVTSKWLKGYDDTTKRSVTTRSMYLRCLRAIINASGAVSPFGEGKDKFQIKTGSGRKMALTKPQIKKLMTYEVIQGSTTDKMRDLFYFSYRANGMNIRDLVLLRWKDIEYGVIKFVRAKTARTGSKERIIKAPVLPEIQEIIDKWGNKDSKYVFGYLHENMGSDDIMLVTKNLTRLMNKHLAIITKATELPKISTYSARHSYATNLLRGGAPIELISGQLGHSRITTTQTYLDGFDMDDIIKHNQSLSDE